MITGLASDNADRATAPFPSNGNLPRTRLLLLLLGSVVAAAVWTGSFNSVDTLRRYQVARWIWAGEPQVQSYGDPGFGVIGRSGERYAWYGIGQSLVMVPFDVVASTVVSVLPPFSSEDEHAKRQIRIGFVALGVSTLTTSVAVIAGFELLLSMGFTFLSAKRGAVTLLLCTTLLTYTQTVMENGLILALTLCSFVFLINGVTTRSTASFIAAGICGGFNLLVRLTTVLDVCALLVFALLLIMSRDSTMRVKFASLAHMFITVTPVLAGFLAVDRIYHFLRFGTVYGTYISLWGDQMKALDPALPTSFPFSTPFMDGFLGAWFSPARSVFIYDPLLVVGVFAIACGWTRLSKPTRAYAVAMTGLLFAYISFYATYYDWGGASFWGNRFVIGPVQALSLIAVPALSDCLAKSREVLRRGLLFLTASLSGLVQASSVVFSVNLEVARFISGEQSSNVLFARWANIASWAIGQADFAENPSRFTVPNFYPFVIAAQWRPGLFLPLMATWLAVLCCSIAVARQLVLASSSCPFDGARRTIPKAGDPLP